MSNVLFAGGQNGFYIVDPISGATLNVLNDGTDNIWITALAFDSAANTMWMATGGGSPVDPSFLYTIHRGTGVKTAVGAIGLGKPCSDIAIDASGNLFGITGGTNPRVCTINKTTGAGTFLGTAITGEWGGAIEFQSGVLYVITQALNVFSVNPSTGARTSLGAITGDASGDTTNAAAVNSDDNSFYFSTYHQIYTLNTSTLVSAYSTTTGTIATLDAICWAPDVPRVPPFIPAPSLDVDNGWYIDHLDHSFSVIASYRPESLHFVKRISAVEDIDWEVSNTAIDVGGDLVVFRDVPTDEDMVKPYANGFQLRKMVEGVETQIMAGLITNTNGSISRNKTKISGKDWLHYLDRREIPYDPLHPASERFGPTVTSTMPPVGKSYQVTARDIADIITDILNKVLGKSYSLPITHSLTGISIPINFSLDLGDTSTVVSIVDGLSEYWPGFDYRVSYSRDFAIWSPRRFGDPDSTANDGPAGVNICWIVGSYYDNPPVDCEYTNSGPKATHLYGTGAGTVNQNKVALAIGASDIQSAFWRLDGAIDFGDTAKNQNTVAARVRKEFIVGAQEVHDITLTVDPATLEDFWNVVRPGLAIWLREDVQFHEINSAQRILEMDCTVNNQGDERVTFGLQQIYDTSSHYGVPES